MFARIVVVHVRAHHPTAHHYIRTRVLQLFGSGKLWLHTSSLLQALALVARFGSCGLLWHRNGQVG